jgi:hypothetical protein
MNGRRVAELLRAIGQNALELAAELEVEPAANDAPAPSVAAAPLQVAAESAKPARRRPAIRVIVPEDVPVSEIGRERARRALRRYGIR